MASSVMPSCEDIGGGGEVDGSVLAFLVACVGSGSPFLFIACAADR